MLTSSTYANNEMFMKSRERAAHPDDALLSHLTVGAGRAAQRRLVERVDVKMTTELKRSVAEWL